VLRTKELLVPTTRRSSVDPLKGRPRNIEPEFSRQPLKNWIFKRKVWNKNSSAASMIYS